MLGMLSEKEKFDHPLGIALCNVGHTCKEMIRDWTSAKEAWEYLKEELEGKAS